MTPTSKLLIDCGINPADGSYPYLNLPEFLPFEDLDAVVITHGHLDHCGALPILYKYGYDGPVYCTYPTREIMSLLQIDYIKVSASDAKKTPYESKCIRDGIKHVIPLKYGETTDISPDVKLTFHNAGHILGSAIAHLHIGDGLHNIAFTGDIKFEKTWLFNPSTNKFPRLETLVIESTYGSSLDIQPTRNDAAEKLKNIIQKTLQRKGIALIPVFAVGRSQEVMIVLEKLIRNNELPTVPVYLDGMIWEATAIHTAYPEYLNNSLRAVIFQKMKIRFYHQFLIKLIAQRKEMI